MTTQLSGWEIEAARARERGPYYEARGALVSLTTALESLEAERSRLVAENGKLRRDLARERERAEAALAAADEVADMDGSGGLPQ